MIPNISTALKNSNGASGQEAPVANEVEREDSSGGQRQNAIYVFEVKLFWLDH
jgi:hypothetical protein